MNSRRAQVTGSCASDFLAQVDQRNRFDTFGERKALCPAVYNKLSRGTHVIASEMKTPFDSRCEPTLDFDCPRLALPGRRQQQVDLCAHRGAEKVGFGRMGLVHLENLALLARDGRIEFAAIGDRHRPSLESAARLLVQWIPAPVLTCDASDAMAAHGALDGCVVASRTADHARDTLSFAGRGIRVLVEKPMAQTMEEAASFVAALGDNDALVQIAFQRHYDAAARAATRWVNDGRIGAIQQSHHVLANGLPINKAADAAVYVKGLGSDPHEPCAGGGDGGGDDAGGAVTTVATGAGSASLSSGTKIHIRM